MKNLTFEQRIVLAALYDDNGDPMKDVLEWRDEERAINVLSDIYVTLGIVKTEDLEEGPPE